MTLDSPPEFSKTFQICLTSWRTTVRHISLLQGHTSYTSSNDWIRVCLCDTSHDIKYCPGANCFSVRERLVDQNPNKYFLLSILYNHSNTKFKKAPGVHIEWMSVILHFPIKMIILRMLIQISSLARQPACLIA